MRRDFYLPAIRIRGFRPFRDVLFRFNRLEVIIGANGSGKSSLFEFLRFIRNSCGSHIPQDIIPGAAGRTLFMRPGEDRFFWNIQVDYQGKIPLFYQGELAHTREKGVKVLFERILTKKTLDEKAGAGFTFLDFRDGKGLVRDPEDGDFLRKEWNLGRSDCLGLGSITDAGLKILYGLREYIRRWRFFSGARLNIEKMRRPVPASLDPELAEDGGNLSAVIYAMKKAHPEAFDDLKSLIMFAIPGFRGLDVKASGGSGEVLACWSEDGVEGELQFSDLSEGILRFVFWAALCVSPSPPSLVCIDDPELGLHPRTLPVLAGLFEKATERTQVLLATHNSHFLTQFDLENMAIMKKSSGGSIFVNVRNSQTLMSKLEQIEATDLEQLYRGDELESLF